MIWNSMGACYRHRLTHRQQEISKLLLPVGKSAVSLKANTDNTERAGAAKLDPVCWLGIMRP